MTLLLKNPEKRGALFAIACPLWVVFHLRSPKAPDTFLPSNYFYLLSLCIYCIVGSILSLFTKNSPGQFLHRCFWTKVLQTSLPAPAQLYEKKKKVHFLISILNDGLGRSENRTFCGKVHSAKPGEAPPVTSLWEHFSTALQPLTAISSRPYFSSLLIRMSCWTVSKASQVKTHHIS